MRRKHLAGILSLVIGACVSANAPLVAEEERDELALTPAHGVVLQTTAQAVIRQNYMDGSFGQIHYWEAGTGTPLLFVHQAGSSCEEAAGLAPYISSDFRLICYDWPGHGMSDDPASELFVDDYSLSAIELLDYMSLPSAHVIGNHGGALIAMNLAWKYPDRVDRLVLSGTSGVKDMDAVQEFSDNLGLDEMNATDRAGESLSAAWDRFTNYMPDSEPGEVVRAFMNNVTVRVRPYDAHYGVLRFDRRPALKAIKDKRILLMQALNDPFVSDQEMLLDILPNAERIEIEDAGVFAFFEAPEIHANEIRTFLVSE